MESVDPAVGFIGEETVVTIRGQQFYPSIDVDATGADPDVEQDFHVSLVLPTDEGGPLTVTLPGAVLDSYEQLTAVVPSGLEPNTYDVVVTGPTGRSGRLVNGYTASATQADHLSVESEFIVYEVYDEIQLGITLRNRDGGRVLADEQIVVYVEAADGTAAPQFSAGSLLDQTPLGPDAIQGRLGADGVATIGLTSTSPDQLTVTATPSDNESPLADGQLVVLFEPGSDVSARLDLPSDPFKATAGTPFPLEVVLVDQFGNEAPDAAATMVLRSTCSSWVDVVEVIGRATVSPNLTQATESDGSCVAERIDSVSGPAGSSAEFDVDPGAAARFDVIATPDTLTAGESQLQVVATPTDAFGNRTAWTGVPLLDDSLGGIGSFDCTVDALVVCSAEPQLAGPTITLTVDGQDGVTGVSSPYAVEAGTPTQMELTIAEDPVVADDPPIVEVLVRDVFGNAVDGSIFSAGAFEMFADGQPMSCTELVSPDERVLFRCPLRQAASDVEVRAVLSGFGLNAAAAPVDVINGALSTVFVTPDQLDLQAGDNLLVDLAGEDAWGNPYIVQTDPNILLQDSLGGFSPVALTLDSLGAAQTTVQPTIAGITTVDATQAGLPVGSSPAVTVRAGTASGLSLQLDSPWIWTGDPTPVTVVATDDFGNQASADGVVTLSSASGSAGDTALSLVEGAGAGSLTWTDSQFDERVDAAGLGLTGAQTGLLIVQDCGAPGPDAAIDADLRTCGVLEQGSINVSMSGSNAGSSPLVLFGLASATDNALSVSADLSVGVTGWGDHALSGIAVATDGCAAQAATTGWLGPDDGSITGPVSLATALDPMQAGVDQAE
ncbi:MAG: hypothetical protein KDA24_27580, partial [Deltaproteobacteria bacterium]|nr:hypothetical protein [Deltaproteobacteria bacterium]